MKFKTIALLFACIFSAHVMVAQSTLSGPPKKPKTTTQTSKPRSNSTSKPHKQNSNRQSSKPNKLSGYINGHEWVDLGLPSGLKWATCNVGASTPEGFGHYFAWGETTTKSDYTYRNCPTEGKDNTWLRNNGYIDSSGNLTMSHDAARQNWGGTWRMPTAAETRELVKNTTSQWTTRNGVLGRLITSKRNGKSIFIPAAGSYSGTANDYVGVVGDCWSATPYNDPNNEYTHQLAYRLYTTPIDYSCNYITRHDGSPIRAVSE